VLVVGHPGHELRVHAWMEAARPEVWVLTDGSGHGEVGRLRSTAAVLEGAGARVGPVFGPFSDRAAYAMLLHGDVAPVLDLTRRLAERLTEPGVYVVADAIEGFNPVHDLCRVVVEAATTIARRFTGHAVDDFDFPLDSSPDGPGAMPGSDVRLVLDAPAIERKLRAARHYPELAEEVARALAAHGEAAFAVERLRANNVPLPVTARTGEPPEYELFGERRVAAGHYPTVLRLRQHFLPFVEALRAAAEEPFRAAS
jgi:hypothetical protein